MVVDVDLKTTHFTMYLAYILRLLVATNIDQIAFSKNVSKRKVQIAFQLLGKVYNKCP